jgi:hypothetical protein
MQNSQVVGILGGAILLVLAQDDDTLLNDFILQVHYLFSHLPSLTNYSFI